MWRERGNVSFLTTIKAHEMPRADLGEEQESYPVPVTLAALTAAGAVRPTVPTDTRRRVGRPPGAHCLWAGEVDHQ